MPKKRYSFIVVLVLAIVAIIFGVIKINSVTWLTDGKTTKNTKIEKSWAGKTCG